MERNSFHCPYGDAEERSQVIGIKPRIDQNALEAKKSSSTHRLATKARATVKGGTLTHIEDVPEDR